jgi:plastocyanin
LALPTVAQEKPDANVKRLAPVNVGGVDDKAGGTVTGVVRFKGTKPEPKPITDVAGNSFCKNCYKGGDLPQRDNVVFGKNGPDDTLQNVLVFVSKGLEGKKFDPPKEKVVLDQVGCVYTPHVVAVMAGQTLEIRNSDATLHNVMSAPRNNPAFNFGMPVKDQKVEKVFKEPEMKMNLKCFMHPWMSSYVHVLDHPFFAVTGPDGTFTIHGLPPGEYELTVLHETSLFEPTPATAAVKVGGGETKHVDFTYQPRPASN